ncbi:hypothetical protein ACLKA6_007122 [Drosophila palustris]
MQRIAVSGVALGAHLICLIIDFGSASGQCIGLLIVHQLLALVAQRQVGKSANRQIGWGFVRPTQYHRSQANARFSKSRRETTKFFLTSDKMNNDSRQLEKAALPEVDYDSVEAIRVEDLGVSSDSDEYDSDRPSKRRRLGLNAILMSRLDESNQIGREISESLRILSEASVERNNILKALYDGLFQLLEQSSAQNMQEEDEN